VIGQCAELLFTYHNERRVKEVRRAQTRVKRNTEIARMESNSGKDSEWGQNENHRANIEARGGAMRISFSLPPFFVP
jgi:hypothetical protein